MDTDAQLFDKHDKKMVDTLVAIQWGQKGDYFSGAELITERYDTLANTLTLVLLSL